MINKESGIASPDVTSQMNFQEIIQAYENGTPSNEGSLTLIAGDASDRKFYRLESPKLNAICMKFPKWEGGYGGDPMSWLGMQSALVSIGIPVPRILYVDEKNACIWTEDFGDNFLNFRLGNRTLDEADPDCKLTINLYRDALGLLAQVQYPRLHLLNHPAQNRAFDFDKLFFEMNFFITHFIRGWLAIPFLDDDKRSKEIVRELQSLCTLLHGCERVLCHRDYHVRNVMVVGGSVRWIDFQDARMGPHTYDVVSLLRDSYVRIAPMTRISLLRFYGSQINEVRERSGKTPWNGEFLFREASLMGLQRNIKALGSFGYLATQKQKTSYLKYIQHTIKTIISDDFCGDSGIRVADIFPVTFGFLDDLLHGPGREKLNSRLRAFGELDTF